MKSMKKEEKEKVMKKKISMKWKKISKEMKSIYWKWNDKYIWK